MSEIEWHESRSANKPDYKGAISLQSGSQFQRKTPLEMKLDRQRQSATPLFSQIIIMCWFHWMAWAKISGATKSKPRKDEDFNTSHMLSKTSPLGWENLF